MTKTLKTLLILSGFAPSNLAGYGRDLEIAYALGVNPVGIITTLTAQVPGNMNAILPLNAGFINNQLKLLCSWYSISAVKIGMVYKKDVMHKITSMITDLKIPVICDPVLNASSGSALMQKTSFAYFKKKLIPKVTLLTPNYPEAKVLSFKKQETNPEVLCNDLFKLYGCRILLKGGHIKSKTKITDIFFDGKEFIYFKRKKYRNINTHGSGCMLSSAIASYVASGLKVKDAVQKAEEFISDCFANPVSINKNLFLATKR